MVDRNRIVGTRVRRLRRERGWSRIDLLRATGFPCSEATLLRLEAGTADWKVNALETIGSAFGVSVVDLVRDDHDESVAEAS